MKRPQGVKDFYCRDELMRTSADTDTDAYPRVQPPTRLHSHSYMPGGEGSVDASPLPSSWLRSGQDGASVHGERAR